MAEEIYWATGRRKRAVARVRIFSGKGVFNINKKPLEKYFPIENLCVFIKQPLVSTKSIDKYDVTANVKGGGISGQAGAVRHGIARALAKADTGLKKTLRSFGFVTRDPRMKERKKYGQKGARKKFQYTKR
ncbi:MAG: 30S ribosomal protein S9 [Candidatus Omnitrophota bacterium]|nr:30S ribosomal protein S9 [Candidatus Omnitrophota bacterium]